MEWFKDLYDEFRMKRSFGSVPQEKTRSEVDFICDVLNLHKGAKVLDLFCGIGRHSIELAKRGYKVVGIEFNPEYLKLAEQNAGESRVSVKFTKGDVRYEDFGKEYDGVIIMFHSFGYFTDEIDQMVLRKLYDSLKNQRRFLLEILSRDWLLKNFIEREEMEINGIRVVEERKFDILTSRNNFTIKRYERGNIVVKKGAWRVYSAHEIKNILEDIGFKFIAGYDNINRAPLTKDTRLMRLVFKK